MNMTDEIPQDDVHRLSFEDACLLFKQFADGAADELWFDLSDYSHAISGDAPAKTASDFAYLTAAALIMLKIADADPSRPFSSVAAFATRVHLRDKTLAEGNSRAFAQLLDAVDTVGLVAHDAARALLVLADPWLSGKPPEAEQVAAYGLTAHLLEKLLDSLDEDEDEDEDDEVIQ